MLTQVVENSGNCGRSNVLQSDARSHVGSRHEMEQTKKMNGAKTTVIHLCVLTSHGSMPHTIVYDM